MKIHLLKSHGHDLDSQANTASPPKKLSISHILLVLFNIQIGSLKIKSGLSQIFSVFFWIIAAQSHFLYNFIASFLYFPKSACTFLITMLL